MNDDNNSNNIPKVPALWLEQQALGELDDASRAALTARMDPEQLAASRATLAESNAEILQALPPSRLVRAIKQRAERTRKQSRVRSWMPGAWTLAPVVSLAALFIVLYDDFTQDAVHMTDATDAADDGVEETRIKGLSPHLVIYRRVGDAVERLADGAQVRAGDELQLAYVAAKQRHGVVLSIDGAGAVTFHAVLSSADQSLQSQRETLLGESYRLDDAPAFERFFFVTAAQPFDPAVVEQAAKVLAGDASRARQGALVLPQGLKQVSFTVNKVQR